MSFELVTSHMCNIDLFWFLRMGELWKVIVCCRKDDGRTKAAGKAANNFNLRSWCCYGYVMFGLFWFWRKKRLENCKRWRWNALFSFASENIKPTINKRTLEGNTWPGVLWLCYQNWKTINLDYSLRNLSTIWGTHSRLVRSRSLY